MEFSTPPPAFPCGTNVGAAIANMATASCLAQVQSKTQT